jgi:hypothetical protein
MDALVGSEETASTRFCILLAGKRGEFGLQPLIQGYVDIAVELDQLGDEHERALHAFD